MWGTVSVLLKYTITGDQRLGLVESTEFVWFLIIKFKKKIS